MPSGTRRGPPCTTREHSSTFATTRGISPRVNVKIPIAINNPSWDGIGTLGAVVRCTTHPRGGGKTHIKERFLVQAPLNYTWNHIRWTSLSKLTTFGGQTVVDLVRTSRENEFRARKREAVQVK